MCLSPSQTLALGRRALPMLRAVAQRASGQAPGRPAAKEDDRGARLAEMKQIAGSFQAAAIDGCTRTPVALVAEPLHRWTDPTRENRRRGSLGLRGPPGWPIAIIAIELYPQDKAFGRVRRAASSSLLRPRRSEVEGGEHYGHGFMGTWPHQCGWPAAMGSCEGGAGVPRDPRRAGPRENRSRAAAANERPVETVLKANEFAT